MIKKTATVEYLAPGWNGEGVGTRGKVDIIRLKRFVEREVYKVEDPRLVRFVESLQRAGKVMRELSQDFLDARYSTLKVHLCLRLSDFAP